MNISRLWVRRARMWHQLVSMPTVVERFKLGVLIVALVICSAAAGSAIGATFLLDPRKHVRVNTSLFMQAVAPAHPIIIGTDAPTAETMLAVDALKLDEIAKQNQESIDDRHTLHDQIAAMATTEVNHYNLLTDRMNVNEARVSAIGWVLGVLFTVSQAVVLFFHLDTRRRNQAAAFSVAPPPRRKRTTT